MELFSQSTSTRPLHPLPTPWLWLKEPGQAAAMSLKTSGAWTPSAPWPHAVPPPGLWDTCWRRQLIFSSGPRKEGGGEPGLPWTGATGCPGLDLGALRPW